MNDSELALALKRSVVALKQVKERVRELESASREPIAIVGMGCRFAGGVSSPDAFWRLLDEGKDAVGHVPRDRWDADALHDPDPATPGKSIAREGGFLTGDVYGFDTSFFGVTPREALGMDPQHRLLMEVVWESLEHAAILPETLMGSATGVFVGANFQEYASLKSQLSELDGYALTGAHPSVASGRISYFLGAKGPSVTLDTACSSSLVAVHFACQSLRAGECDAAIAGGVGLMLAPTVFVEFSRLRGLARDGRSKAFDAAADGMGWGEGCGVVVLKRLSSAIAAGDHVHAVIRGSAVNQDGRSHGLTAPNGPSQRRLIAQALERAGVAPSEIAYVEAHGAGTPLGDPIEVQALGEALAAGRSAAEPVLVGSVKTNIGHTMAAAGVAGLIKTVLALRHRRIPRSLHLTTPSPHIPWETLPVRVATESTPWPEGRRVAGVSSFGVSGTNAHVVVEAHDEERAEPTNVGMDRAAHLLVLSARTPEALVLQASRYAEHIEARPEIALADLCHAAVTTRTHFEERLAVIASTRDEARASLLAWAAQADVATPPAGCVRGTVPEGHRRPKVAFLFTGQGAQYAGMGRELYEREPVFRDSLDRCAKILEPLLETPLLSVMFEDRALLDETRYTQPALFAFEVSLAALWQSWGIVPDVVMGHSVGEYAAAYVAGVFSLEDGLALIAARGRLMHALPPGGEMASIKADLGRVTRALERHGRDVSIGAYNGPESIVISGRREQVDAIREELEAEGIKTKTLNVSIASHSPLMDPMLDEFERVARSITFHAPSVTFVSNVTGAAHGPARGDEVPTPSYWRRHVREPVRFEQGMTAIRALGADTFIEVGPHPTLLAMAAACTEGSDVFRWLPSLKKDQTTAILLESLGRLHVHGAPIAWPAFDAPFSRRRVSLPTYAFDRATYRAAASTREEATTGVASGLAGARIDVPGPALHRAVEVGLAAHPHLSEHEVHGRVVLPGSFYVAVLLAIAAEMFGASRDVTLRELTFARPLVVSEKTTLHVVLTPAGEEAFELRMCSAKGGAWHDHASGFISSSRHAAPRARSLAELRATKREVAVAELFDRFAAMHVVMGPGWRWIDQALRGGDGALVHVRAAGEERGAPLHPILLDNSFAASVLARESAKNDEETLLLWRVGELRFHASAAGASATWCHARARAGASEETRAVDLELLDDEGRPLLEVDGLTFKRAAAEAFSTPAPRPSEDERPIFEVAWVARAAAGARDVRGERWLVVAVDHARGEALARRLAAAGASATLSSQEEIEEVVRAGGPLDAVVWWASVRDPASASDASQTAARALAVLQACARRAAKHAPRLWLVTEGTQAAAAGDRVDPSASVVWGLGRAAAEEHPELRCTLVDLAPATNEEASEVLAEALVERDDAEREIAIRAGKRFAARLVVANAPRETPSPARLDEGTVLITGGLGGLGLSVAEWLVASRGVRHLVLAGRRAPNDEACRRVEALRAKGVNVDVHRADVARAEDVARVLAAIPPAAPLRGVFHLAGVVDGARLLDLTPSRLEAVLSAKVGGAWNLHVQTRALPLDVFVLFSSIQAIVGSASQGNYAAANAFLDALAHHRRQLGLAGQSLDWGAWSGAGMAARLDEAERVSLARAGFLMLTPDAGLSLFARALARPEAQLTLASIDRERLRRAFEGDEAATPPILRALVPRPSAAPSKTRLRDRLRAMPLDERERAVLDLVRAEVAAALRIANVASLPLDRPLKQLGLDSLIAVELPTRLKALTGEPMPSTLLYGHPTVKAVATFVAEALSRSFGESRHEEQPARAATTRRREAEPIAIVGMACRAPGGCHTPEGLWDLVRRGEPAISAPPAHRGWSESVLGGFLHDADAFDPHFFDLSEREATLMDPQQRLLLEVSWEALERAGIPASSLEGSRTGVFAGVIENAYSARAQGSPDAHDRTLSLGSRASVASARIAYALGLRGPVMTIDTACSSSLVALHLACQALRAGECDLALAGGATVLASPDLFLESLGQHMLATDGRCKPFADAADGIVWAEGVGLLVLARLDDALQSGHPILAVVRGSALNHDGRGQGLTTPSGVAQREVIAAALTSAGVGPSDVDLLEAHGTGTRVGDAIEASAIAEVYGRARRADAPLWIGNVKPILGHTQAAAGVLGVIHTVVSMQRGQVPAMPSMGPLNRDVDWSSETVRVSDQPRPWTPTPGRPRRASVSAFGVGTNAHVILEETEATRLDAHAGARDAKTTVLLVSAKTTGALREQARQMAAFLEHDAAELADVAFTAATRRTHLRRRLAILAARREDAIASLRVFAGGADDLVMVAGSHVEGHAGDEALRTLAEAHVQGASVDWAAALGGGRFVPIPTYAFQRSRYWLAKTEARETPRSPEPSGDALARLVAMAEDDRRSHLFDLVRTETAAVLGVPEPQVLAADRSLFQLGLDSLRATTLRNRLTAVTGTSLPATLVFEHPTVSAIAERLLLAVAEASVTSEPGAAPYEELEI